MSWDVETSLTRGLVVPRPSGGDQEVEGPAGLGRVPPVAPKLPSVLPGPVRTSLGKRRLLPKVL